MAITACATAVVTSTVLALTSSDGVDARRTADLPLLESIPADVAALVPAFKRPQRASDRIPGGDPVAALERLEDRQHGENPRLARRVARGPAYVWPMTRGVCYWTPGPSGCVRLRLIAEHGVVLGTTTSADRPTARVFGIAVAGIDRVVFTRADGTETAARVANGALYAELPADVVEARWTKPDGSRGTQALRVP